MKELIFIFAIFLLLVPLVSSDIISPGFKPIGVHNFITNFEDFPDYYFLTVCKDPMYEVSLIEDGKIGYCYKFSELSVYVVKKQDFDILDIDKINGLNNSDFKVYFSSEKFQEVISNLEHFKVVPISSTQENITHFYRVDINITKNSPDDTVINRNNLIYFYIGIPILALIVIILLKRRK